MARSVSSADAVTLLLNLTVTIPSNRNKHMYIEEKINNKVADNRSQKRATSEISYAPHLLACSDASSMPGSQFPRRS